MEEIDQIFSSQQDSFSKGFFRPYEARKAALLKLRRVILKNEQKIVEALYKDLGKGEFESIISETLFVIQEIDYTLRKLKKWMRRRRVSTSLLQFPARSYILPMPIGPVLVISPWNYPFQLLLSPAVGAIAAGNNVVMKPSEITPTVSHVIAKLINDNFAPDFLHVVEGEIPETQALLEKPFAHIFYTGNSQVGKIVMRKAAENLTPVTLELGGKSPCLIYGSVNIETVARRIAWTKFFNAGQTCVAPDYVLLPKDKKQEFVESITKSLKNFFGEDYGAHTDYGRIVNSRHLERLLSYIEKDKVAIGGDFNKDDLFLAPTVLEATAESPSMKEEIFGPILPIIEIDSLDDAISFVKQRDHPLAAYVYSNDSSVTGKVVDEVLAGGMTVNDCVVHLTSHNLPFGGVGNSGIGSYHGAQSFELFSHKKSVLHRGLWLDLPLRYPPYKGKLELLKKLVSWFS